MVNKLETPLYKRLGKRLSITLIPVTIALGGVAFVKFNNSTFNLYINNIFDDKHEPSSSPQSPTQAAVQAPILSENSAVQRQLNSSEQKAVALNSTEEFFQGAVIISVSKISVEDEVSANIGSNGNNDANIESKKVGYSIVYKSGKENYRIRIINVNCIGNSVVFAATKI